MEFAKLREVLNTKLLFSYNKGFVESLNRSLIFLKMDEKYLSIYLSLTRYICICIYLQNLVIKI